MNTRTPRRLLACDLDGTMFPTGLDPTHAAALDGFAELRAAHDELMVAYVTGRHLSSALEAMAFWSLPHPDLLSCDVGTSIYRPNAGAPEGWSHDDGYAALMREAMGGLTAEDIARLLDGVPDLTPQDADRQAEFKISYALLPDAAGDAALTEVGRRLAAVDAAFNMVRSSGVYEQDDLLDILPPGATKTSAVTFMTSDTEVMSGPTLYAGDSRNDLAPLLACDGGIVVANARPALLDALRPVPDSIYLARRPHLHGVVEGVLHFLATDSIPKGDG